ncbi:MAG TPA: FAD-dependent oxidoreductase [Candidatus Saccharimonadales bacterium]|nr:FAD-dependent oxidoreductase [Candidatus Saccharimonadales bacterium]
MLTNIKLIKKEEIATGTMAFHFEKPEGFEFRAGQFLDITLLDPPETDAEGDTRGFSIASAPYEAELMVATRLRDTAFKRVLRDLPLGTELKLDAPYGDFTLHKTETTPAVFLIGGIGVTPVRSMVAQAIHDGSAQQLTLIHANRTPADAPFAADFQQLVSVSTNFNFVPVATDEAPDDWTGERGHVDEAMLRRHLSDLNAPIYYLAGPQGMVKAMRQLLVDIGVNEDNIRTEEFTGY